MDDQALADALARNLDAAFGPFVHTHADRCYAIALRVLGDPHDAEEVAQDALVRAYRALASYEPERIRSLRLRPWLATIVVNLCRNHARRGRPTTVRLDGLAEVGAEPATADRVGPVALAEAADDRARLAAALASLPELYRVPLILRHVVDLSYAELAEALGRPEGTLKAEVHRGLAMLRAGATEAGLEEVNA